MKKSNVETGLENALNIAESPSIGSHMEILPPSTDITEVTPVDAKNDQVEDDYQMAREQLRELAHNGQAVITRMNQLAEIAESPRMFEVLAKMIDSVAKVNQDLLNLSDQKATIDNKHGRSGTIEGDAEGEVNIYFRGTTSDLLATMKNAAAEKKDKK